MQQIAWLHAVPKAPDGFKGKADERTRLARLTEEGIEPDLPGVTCRYLLEYLFEIGPAMPGAMGEVPLTHGEIEAWQRNTGIRLQPWEARALRRASIEYVRASIDSTDAQAPAPYRGEAGDLKVAIVATDLRDDIRRLAKL